MAAKTLQRMNLDPSILRKLVNRRLFTAKDLLLATHLELAEGLDISSEAVSSLILIVSHAAAPRASTVLDLYGRAQHHTTHLPTHLSALDAVLRGGVPVGAITELVGPAGVGKSQLCHMLAVSTLLPITRHQPDKQTASVMYIDTEKKFSSRRVVEIAKARWPQYFTSQETIRDITERILVVNPGSSEALISHIKALEGSIIDHNIKLVLVDSIAALARSEFSRDKVVDRQQMLGQQAAILKSLAETFRIPVVVVNQVTAQVHAPANHPFQGSASTGNRQQESHLTAALGTVWAHAVNTRLVLESVADVRYIKVAKSPAAPLAAFAYRITEAGLNLLDGHRVPDQVQSSIINMHVAHEISYEPQPMGI
ncbi:DNA repair protein RAD51 [Trebouxia sp. C0010 RCD-2024]